MTSREIVRRAIEFQSPPRLPFWQHRAPGAPDDVCDIWEMDRQRAGWFFDTPGWDDWGCLWEITDVKNMGQVTVHPLADAASLRAYRPPDPLLPYYYERIDPLLGQSRDRYVVLTCHFNLIERLYMLRGFAQTMEDLLLEPELVERLLDMVLEFKLAQIEEIGRRFGEAIDGLFLTDDWGTQQGTFISRELFERHFAPRYARLFAAIRGHRMHTLFHSCGRINDFVPRLIELGADALNMGQPRAYGLVEFGEQFRGRACFLTGCDVQATLPRGSERAVREEARLLVEHWSVPAGGLIILECGDPAQLGVSEAMAEVMYDEFVRLRTRWQGADGAG
jgi:uroporphyrinogen decarboxylase